jgi:hypothetical protein
MRKKRRWKEYFPVHPACTDVPMALSVLDSTVSSSNAYKRIVKAMDELQDSVSEVCNTI